MGVSYENRSLESLESLEQGESNFHYLVAAFSAMTPVLEPSCTSTKSSYTGI